MNSDEASGPDGKKNSPKKREYRRPSESELRARLTPEQFAVSCGDGTEPPFQNAYWDHHEAGIYVDVASGEPLFSSQDKFDSGTGWPSFCRPLEPENLVTKVDRKLFATRTEVRSRSGDSHLGHLFPDGPAPTGLRYCMNSASLRFIPLAKLEAEGYGEYRALFGGGAGGDVGGGSGAGSGGGSGGGGTLRETATLAGGCFWGVEELLRELPGVLETTVGYTGGTVANAVYEQVKTGKTGHAESIQIVFDPQRLSYENLLRFFFRLHDPTTLNAQGNDRGTQYRSAIFYHSEKQRETALRVRGEVEASGKWKRPLVTEITEASAFYSAEDYHQDYLRKNPGGYTCHFVRD